MCVKIDCDDLVDLACERLTTVWQADSFEVQVLQGWLRYLTWFDKSKINLTKIELLVDDFHVNRFSEITPEAFHEEKHNKKNEHFLLASSDVDGVKRYAFVDNTCFKLL